MSDVQTARQRPMVRSFFHRDTSTFTHVAYERPGGAAAIIDPVLDYDASTARTATTAADEVLAFVRAQRLQVQWLLETHAHADHLSAGAYLHDALGAPLAIGSGIVEVQARFKQMFALGADFVADGSQFDRLWQDGDAFRIGALEARAIATPGHTGDSLSYLIGDAVFVGDTVFAPSTGTGRSDFPGGDAGQLYESIQRLLALPADTRVFLCHDYPAGQGVPAAESTVAAQAAGNVHVGAGVSRDAFVAMRRARDAQLPAPRLILPALQVNIRGGRLPAPAANGISYLQIPLNTLGGRS
jgi:glyoxylase-like metal-dependent hydrolase (beta-lactamase superfamily II)